MPEPPSRGVTHTQVHYNMLTTHTTTRVAALMIVLLAASRLSPAPNPLTAPPPTITVTAEYLWLRAGPGIEHARVAILRQGEHLLPAAGPPAANSGNWIHVWTRAGTGYVNSRYTTHPVK